MNLKSITLGVLMTAVLFCLLVITRMMDVSPVIEELQIREVQTVSLPEPNDVDVIDDVSVADSLPTPSLNLPSVAPTLDVSELTLPELNINAAPELVVNAFSTDQAPAPLPVVQKKAVAKIVPVTKIVPVNKPKVAEAQKVVSKSQPKPKRQPRSEPQPKPQPRPTPAVVKKSVYSVGELDQKLVWKYSPKVTFPRSIRDTDKGRVVVDITILPSGKTKLTSVVSSSHPELVSLAKRLANGSRFSKPTHQGQPVTVTKRWPIVIQK